jgi:hypothetical protein
VYHDGFRKPKRRSKLRLVHFGSVAMERRVVRQSVVQMIPNSRRVQAPHKRSLSVMRMAKANLWRRNVVWRLCVTKSVEIAT